MSDAVNSSQPSAKTPVTARDVARNAGVSQSTVSRAFANSQLVSRETRDRIFLVAEQLGYQVNIMARGLSTQKSGLIAVVTGSTRNPFYWDVLRLVDERLQAKGMHVMLMTVKESESTDSAVRKVHQYRVDGLLVLSAELSSKAIDECREFGLPVVLFNRYVETGKVSAVACDNIVAGKDIAQFLYNTNHKRFAFISGLEDSSTNKDRFQGYRDQLAKLGCPPPLVEGGDFTYENGRQAVKRLMLRSERPDAIFCANDITAIGALDGIRVDLGMRVPEDVSIIGFDDIAMSSWSGIELTTMRQQTTRMVDSALEILLRRIDAPELKPEFRLEPGKLMIRRTVRLDRQP
ncbi:MULTISPECIES: substrate-binding domain-containing protein [Chelativorans]|uniref:Transcriptional regulator, LacI family n=1 Tax=Chelativorans sp. (strain BNC1) TaxID=266779 RepID=Q11H03_CHESB